MAGQARASICSNAVRKCPVQAARALFAVAYSAALTCAPRSSQPRNQGPYSSLRDG